MKNKLLLATVLVMGSCSHQMIRVPSSDGEKSFVDVEKLSEQYTDNIQLDKAIDELPIAERIHDEDKISSLNNVISELKQKTSDQSVEMSNRADTLGLTHPVSMQYDYENNFRIQNEKLIIQNPENYKLVNEQIVRTFSMDINNVKSYQLGIVNWAFKEIPKKETTYDEGPNDTRRYFDASISCDADFKIKKVIFNKKVSKNKQEKFRIYEHNNGCNLS